MPDDDAVDLHIEFPISRIRHIMLQKALDVQVLGPDQEEGPLFEAVGEDIVGGEAPVGEVEGGAFGKGVPVDHVAEGGALVELRGGLDDRVGVHAVGNAEGGGEMELVMPVRRGLVGLDEGQGAPRIVRHAHAGAVDGGQDKIPFVQSRVKMGIKFMEELTESIRKELFPLLDVG